MKPKFVSRDTYRRLRLQFDAIGLTKKKGWDEGKIFAFVNKPNWYKEYSWTREQSDRCYAKMVNKRLLDKEQVPFYDLDKGWRDE